MSADVCAKSCGLLDMCVHPLLSISLNQDWRRPGTLGRRLCCGCLLASVPEPVYVHVSVVYFEQA